ncbi:MAG: nickel pincer cofactor biosynthesis protein LarC2, partial [Candidatus Xenobia bacterium]
PFPNLLRVLLSDHTPAGWLQQETLLILETNVDDCSPQIFEPLIDTALALGARDVTLTPILMKKSRPAVQVSILTPATHRDRLLDLLLRETTTLGVRVLPVERWSLPRRMLEVTVAGTSVQVKVALDADGKPLKLIPEYADCRAAAQATGRPLLALFEEAREQARLKLEKSHGAEIQTG